MNWLFLDFGLKTFLYVYECTQQELVCNVFALMYRRNIFKVYLKIYSNLLVSLRLFKPFLNPFFLISMVKYHS